MRQFAARILRTVLQHRAGLPELVGRWAQMRILLLGNEGDAVDEASGCETNNYWM